MILKQAWVDDSSVSRWYANAAAALLEHDGENEASVDASLAGHALDTTLDVRDLLIGVLRNIELRTSTFQDDLVEVEHVLETRDPVGLSRPWWSGASP